MFSIFQPLSIFFIALALLIATGPTATAQSELRLAPGDTIAFSVLGVSSLDRQATIAVDGTIYLPLAGTVSTSNLTIDEFRTEVYTSLSDRAYRVIGTNGEDVWRRLQEDDLYIDIFEYRPVYVTGDVRNPGEVRYRPGMSVRQAIAIAGGVGLPAEENTDDEKVRLLTERNLLFGRIKAQTTDLDRYKTDLNALLAAQVAEENLGGEEASSTIDGANSTELEAVAQRWLEARADLRGLTDNGNNLVLDRMSNRLEVLEELESASQQYLVFEEEELARAMELSERGVIPTSTLSEARSGLLQASTRALETSGEVLRMRLDMTRFAEDAKADQTSEQVRLLESISNGTARLNDLEQQLIGLDSRLAVLGAVVATEQQEASIQIELFRTGLGETSKVDPISSSTAMAPGDVLEVTLKLPGFSPIAE